MAPSPRRIVPTLVAVAALLLAGAGPGVSATGPAGPAGDLEGTAVRVVIDDPHGDDTRTEVRVVTGAGAVVVPDGLAEGLSGGDRVRVDAERSGVSSVEVLSPVEPASQLGRHDVVVAPLYFSGSAPSTPTATQLRQMVSGMDSYLATTTNGQVRVAEHQVRPWSRVSLPSPTCEAMYDAVFGTDLAARMAGTMAPGPASHVVLYTPQLADCPWVGIATMGVGAHGYPIVWLNGDRTVSTATHELGHNMGLGHTGHLDCYSGSGAEVVGLSGRCDALTYQDVYDVMSAPLTDFTTGVPGEMAAYHQRRLGTMTSAHVPVVGAGTHTLNRLSATSGVRGLQVRISDTRTLQLEYRTAARLDDWIQTFRSTDGRSGPGAGVVVRVLDPSRPTSDLSTVDLQGRDDTYRIPAPGGGYYEVDTDAPAFLPVGTTWNVQGASPATSITVTAATSGSATVVVGGSTRATSVQRWEGGDRWATAARIATSAYPSGARTVFLANGRGFADALTGAPVAGRQGAPMLLTPPGNLAGATRRALTTLGAREVVILGGTAAVSGEVEDELRAMGLTVRRWSGEDRFLTAVEISRQAFPEGAPCLYVASAVSFPDALSGAPAAGAGGCALLLVSGRSARPEVRAEVARLDPDHVVLVGGTGAVSADAAASVMSAAPGATQVRMEGTDRWSTSAAVSRQGPFPTTRAQVFVASGVDFPDALALAAVAAHRKAPLLLTGTTHLPSVIDREIRRLPTPRAVIAGGTTAVSTEVEERVAAALR